MLADKQCDTLCLTCERYPLTLPWDDTDKSRLLREIARQGVLVAAREELGLATRDETLGEPFTGDPGCRLSLRFRPWKDTPYEMQLQTVGGAGDALWKSSADISRSALRLAEHMTEQSAKLADALREAGFPGRTSPPPADEERLEEVERLLGQMDFVSQYAAVRAAHRAQASGGASPAWLTVLVRGYAHLALLTQHLWSTHTEVFAARSVLYAERCGVLTDDSPESRAARAYAWALVGQHRWALEKLAEHDGDGSEGEAENGTESGAAPAWTRVVRPYCEFDREALRAVADEHGELEGLVARLEWEHYRSSWHGRWIYEKGLEAVSRIPEAYGVYNEMATRSPLKIKRVGSRAGLMAFSRLLPRRVGLLSGLPETAGASAAADDSSSPFSPAPSRIARSLRKATEGSETRGEPSWAVLGELIAEEQFVQVANFMKVSTDAVESSLDRVVDAVLPLIAGHRYEGYIESYAAHREREPTRFAAAVERLRVVDPRGNMAPMFSRLWQYQCGDHPSLNGRMMYWHALWSHGHTHPGLHEVLDRLVSYGRPMKNSDSRWFAEFVEFASPHSSITRRMRIQFADSESVDGDRLAEWEAEATDDPISWMLLGNHYFHLPDYESAIRCYRRSLEISPSLKVTQYLADSLWRNGETELWQPTLESYLEHEDLGLAHAQVHQQIANYRISQGDYAGAEEHAVAAGETWSAWGLMLASTVYEGLRDWEQSERWVAEVSKAYPSGTSGLEWYLWCCRTGRGDLTASSELAERWARAPGLVESGSGDNLALYHELEGRFAAALRVAQQTVERHPKDGDAYHLAWRMMRVVELADRAGEDALRDKTIARLREHTHGPLKAVNKPAVPIIDAWLELWDESKAAASVDDLDSLLHSNWPTGRCDFRCFFANALASRGELGSAETLWRRSAFEGPFDRLMATAAGARLVRRFGPGRGGPPGEQGVEPADETRDGSADP